MIARLHIYSDANIGRLRDDYRVLCPTMTAFSSTYSAIFFLMFPCGIPVFMIASMRYKGIKDIVRVKMQSAKFSAMLALFMKRTCSIEAVRVARLVGDVDHDEVCKHNKNQSWLWSRKHSSFASLLILARDRFYSSINANNSTRRSSRFKVLQPRLFKSTLRRRLACPGPSTFNT